MMHKSQKSKVKSQNLGFTLVELLVVISIIGILATLLFSNLMGARQRGRDTARKADLDQMRKALEMYKGSQNPPSYPASLAVLAATTNYLPALPHDPLCPNGTCSSGWSDYSSLYTRGGDILTYTLKVCLENASDPQKDASNTCSAGTSLTRTEP